MANDLKETNLEKYLFYANAIYFPSITYTKSCSYAPLTTLADSPTGSMSHEIFMKKTSRDGSEEWTQYTTTDY